MQQYNCKGCSKSCWIKIELEQGRVRQVTGHRCQRGKDMVVNLFMMD